MGGSDSSPVQAGHVIAGKYRLLQQLGRGGMGAVWLAEHLVLESQVAVKVIDTDSEDKAQLARRFVREAKAAAALNSPHVVRIFDYGVEDDMPYMVMERLEGESLRSRIDREQKLAPALTLTILTHVARGLVKAHEAGIVHRDLKPDNVYLVGSEDELLVKILDFGIAKDTKDLEGAETNTGAVIGSPYYLSPEQARGHKNIDHRTDLWALGILAYECLTGVKPFDAESLGDLLLQICIEPIPPPSSRGAVPDGFDDWFAKATMRDREQRFRTAKEMVTMLRRSLGAAADPGGLSTTDGAPRISLGDTDIAEDVPTIRDPAAGTQPSITPALGLSNTTAAVSSSSGPGAPRIARSPAMRIAAAGVAVALVVVAIVAARSGGDGAAAEKTSPPHTAAAAPKPPEPAPTPAVPPAVAEPIVTTPSSAPDVPSAPSAARRPVAPRRPGAPAAPAATGSPQFDPLGKRF